MIKALLKLGLWFIVGCGIVGFTMNMTDLQVATPWAYTVNTSAAGVGSVTVTGPEADGEATVPVNLTTGVTPTTYKADRRLDLGAVTFMFALYGGGTIMGALLKSRKKGKWVLADQG